MKNLIASILNTTKRFNSILPVESDENETIARMIESVEDQLDDLFDEYKIKYENLLRHPPTVRGRHEFEKLLGLSVLIKAKQKLLRQLRADLRD